MLFIALSNYDDLLKLDGKQVATFAAAKLSQHVVGFAAATDIVGQTKDYEFALLCSGRRRWMSPLMRQNDSRILCRVPKMWL